MFRNYVLRFPTLFPDRKSECPILNTEEMATLYHFPITTKTTLAPSAIEKTESKKSQAPAVTAKDVEDITNKLKGLGYID